jgi:hypothetical protein
MISIKRKGFLFVLLLTNIVDHHVIPVGKQPNRTSAILGTLPEIV